MTQTGSPTWAPDQGLDDWTRNAAASHARAAMTALTLDFLDSMPTSLKKEFLAIFEAPAKALSQPRNWKPPTIQMHARALLDASIVAGEAQLAARGITDLASPITLEAISKRVEYGIWAGQNAARVTKGVRTVHYAVHGYCPGLLTRYISRFEKFPGRDINDNVREEEEYIEAALAAIDDGRAMLSEGNGVRARIRIRDGALFGVVTRVNWRRGETAAARVELIWIGPNSATVLVQEAKTNTERLVLIDDPRVIQMIRILTERKSGSLLVRADGQPLGPQGVYCALVRTGHRYMDLHTTNNVFRRVGVSAVSTPEAKRDRGGHSEDSNLAELIYTKPLAEEGLFGTRAQFKKLASRLS